MPMRSLCGTVPQVEPTRGDEVAELVAEVGGERGDSEGPVLWA